MPRPRQPSASTSAAATFRDTGQAIASMLIKAGQLTAAQLAYARRAQARLATPQTLKRFMKNLWGHAIGCALGAKWLAENTGHQALAQEALLLQQWNLPEPYCIVSRDHHPADYDTNNVLRTTNMIDSTPVALRPDVINAEHLPTLPTVAIEILRLCHDEAAGIEELTTAISLDPALAARILKLANSPAYRRSADITSLSRAVLLLGMRAVQLLALSFSLTQSFPHRGVSKSFDYLGYWQYSLTMAVAGQELARLIQSPYQHEAFLCGLLGRLGQLVLAEIMPDRYTPVIERTPGSLPTATIEHSILGFDHHQVGATLLQSWTFPELLVDTIRFWETPDALPSETHEAIRTLCHLIQMANLIGSAIWSDPAEKAIQTLHEYGGQYFGLEEVEIDTCFLGLESRLAEIASLFDIEVANLPDFQIILTEAHDRLVQLSLNTAQELAHTTARTVELEQENQRLAKLARIDKLTGLYNRTGLDTALAQVVEARVQGRNTLGLLIIDIDHFKAFNDTYGHLLGDEVLKRVAKWIAASTRQTDIVARYGGEEFVVLLPRTTFDELGQIAERIRLHISEGKVIAQGKRLAVTVSVGGACVDKVHNLEDGVLLLKHADQCLYEAKAAGRNRVICQDVTDLLTS